MVVAGLGIIYLLPYITKAVPSPLVAIVVITIFCILTDIDLRTVGDMGQLPNSFPLFIFPDVPFNLQTLWIVLPYSLTLAAVGLLESLMTAVIVDDMTDTNSNKNRECKGQGVANIISGFFGGMAGCAMIGQSVINVKSGGRGRLSTFFAGAFLLFLILVLSDWVRQIPMAALVSVMIMVSIGTFDWNSIKNIRTTPKASSLVMLTTVGVVLYTHDLAQGVFIGVLMSSLFFASKVSKLLLVQTKISEKQGIKKYEFYGQVFFASADRFTNLFDYKEDINNVIIDLTHTHFWDISAVAALDKVVLKFRRENTSVEIIGLNQASKTLVDKFSVYDNMDDTEIFPH